MLDRGLIKLTEREQAILVNRRLRDDPLTLKTLGEEYGISRERVRQIEKRAFEKLQGIVREEALAADQPGVTDGTGDLA